MYEQKRPDVAVFIDFENVYVSVRDKLNANPNFEAIMDRCSDLGRVVLSRAYADWYRYPRVTSALYANAIEPIYVATYYYDKDAGRTGRAIKNSVDMNLAIDAMKTLYTHTNISRFVLVTGDRDFIPLVHSIRQQGKEVYVIGIGGAASTHLAQSADEFVFYEQLVGKQVVASATATAISQRPGELTRGNDLYEPLPVEPPTPAPVAVPTPAPVAVPMPVVVAAAAETDIYSVLIDAVHLVRKRGYVSTLGSLKLVMKELMGGDFKESRYRDVNGRSFVKFKDFVVDAEKRGKVQIFTSGTVNEVFLPGEDPYKLSQFAQLLSDDGAASPAVVAEDAVQPAAEPTEPAAEPTEPVGGRRRRRRPRRGSGSRDAATAAADSSELEPPMIDADLEYVAPLADEPAEPAVVEPAAAVVDAVPAPAPVDQAAAVTDTVDSAVVEPVAAVEVPADVEVAPRRRRRTRRAAEPAAVEAAAAAAAEPAAADVAPVVETPAAADVAPVVETPAAVETPAVVAAVSAEAEEAGEEPIEFSAEEWVLLAQTARGLGKPVTFQQLADTLRSALKAGGFARTNEQTRTLVKQALRREMFVRTVKAKRVYYTLAD
jgi:uncharacterized protein (TIGR00288 family)